MSRKKVLFLGTCGINKSEVAKRLNKWCTDHFHQSLKIVDFEHGYLSPPGSKPFSSYLWNMPVEQFGQWREGWERLQTSGALNDSGSPIVLLMHGAIVTGGNGVRIVCNPAAIIESFRPDLVLTLIDDVYDLWWRTEARAQGDPRRGRPSIEQLLTARRVEQAIGEQFAGLSGCRHLLLSVNHPCECAARLIFDDPWVAYLAFPISEPRRMEARGDTTGIELINEYHRKAFEYQRKTTGVVFISPIAIDERPLVDSLDKSDRVRIKENNQEYEAISFPRDAHRWANDSYWPPNERLGPGPPPESDRKPLPLSQIKDAEGTIRTDVGWRDHQLVLQANSVAACCPVMNNRGELAGGVRNEIHYACVLGDKGVYYWQDSSHDRQNAIAELESGTSAMGENALVVKRCESMEELIQRAVTRID